MMEGYEPVISFGEDVARGYRDFQRGDESATVAFLEQLAGSGPALELAIGTGRIALPLAARGIRVDGVDISPAMVDQLRAKPGGDQLAVTIGDLADVPVPGTYRLIFVVWNSLFNLLTQEDQVRCIENVAAHLTDDGSFVSETYVPAYLYRLRNDQHVDAEAIEVDKVYLDVLRRVAGVRVPRVRSPNPCRPAAATRKAPNSQRLGDSARDSDSPTSAPYLRRRLEH